MSLNREEKKKQKRKTARNESISKTKEPLTNNLNTSDSDDPTNMIKQKLIIERNEAKTDKST